MGINKNNYPLIYLRFSCLALDIANFFAYKNVAHTTTLIINA